MDSDEVSDVPDPVVKHPGPEVVAQPPGTGLIELVVLSPGSPVGLGDGFPGHAVRAMVMKAMKSLLHIQFPCCLAELARN